MISACVFSKNRPMQLDAFLKSSAKNATYITDMNVLYTYTDIKFNDGYEILRKEHPNVNFIKEDNLHQQILDLVSGFQDYFLWATDDSIFYKSAILDNNKIDWVFQQKKCMALNLRMGLNIKWQNHWHSETSPEIIIEDEYKDLIVWDAEKYNVNTDVGRVWQNDASIMPTKLYLERLNIESGWKHGLGVRELDNLAGSGRIFSPCLMASFRENVYLNIPVTLVHLLNDGRLYADNWGRFFRYDVDDLNQHFLNGNRIDWEQIDTNNLDCGRKEVEYKFI